MRRLYQFLAGILAIIFFLWGISAYMQSRTGNVSDKLVIYNWGDYIDPDLLTKFTKETGIKVQYETFDFRFIQLHQKVFLNHFINGIV